MSAPFAPASELDLTVGSLCSGYLGADAALAAVLGSRTIWAADNDPDVATLLAERFPGPNLGDIKTVDWAAVERPRIITAGFPCQDISPAGRRAGIAPGTRSGLWTWIAYVIEVLQPDYVFIENSRGLTSARAHSGVESCAFCVGDESIKPALRALGRVLGDLAERGYDAEWCVVSATDVGAPHKRARAFIWAWRRGIADPGCLSLGRAHRDVAAAAGAGAGEQPADGQWLRALDWDGGASAAHPASLGAGEPADQTLTLAGGGHPRSVPRGGGDLAAAAVDAEHNGSPRAAAGGGAELRSAPGRARGRQRARADGELARAGGAAPPDADHQPRPDQLGGHPAAAADRPELADADLAGRQIGAELPAGQERAPAQRDCRDGDGPAGGRGAADAGGEQGGVQEQVGGEVGRAIAWWRGWTPCPEQPGRWHSDRHAVCSSDPLACELAGAEWRGTAGERDAGDTPEGFIWRVGAYDYTASIAAWEAITGRAAPLAALANGRGEPRLNPRLSEWMMGLPDGWVTGVPGLGRPAQLRIIGNGLVPAQGALALEILTARAADASPDAI